MGKSVMSYIISINSFRIFMQGNDKKLVNESFNVD